MKVFYYNIIHDIIDKEIKIEVIWWEEYDK